MYAGIGLGAALKCEGAPRCATKTLRRISIAAWLVALFASTGCANTKTTQTTAPLAVSPPSNTQPHLSTAPHIQLAPPKPVHPSTNTGASQQCDQNISSDPNTSCELAFNTFKAFVAKHASQATVEVYGPKSNTWYSIQCQNNGGAVTCTGGHEILIVFPLRAAEVYEPHQSPTPKTERSTPAPYVEPPAGAPRIPNYENGKGYPVECADGQWSKSGGIQGACSHHRGERYKEPTYKEPSYKPPPEYKEPKEREYKEPAYKEPTYREPKEPSYKEPSYKEPTYREPSYK
jgi:hypothetical protein